MFYFYSIRDIFLFAFIRILVLRIKGEEVLIMFEWKRRHSSFKIMNIFLFFVMWLDTEILLKSGFILGFLNLFFIIFLCFFEFFKQLVLILIIKLVISFVISLFSIFLIFHYDRLKLFFLFFKRVCFIRIFITFLQLRIDLFLYFLNQLRYLRIFTFPLW